MNEEGLPFVDIVEEYHSDEEKKPTKQTKKKGRHFMKNILKVKSIGLYFWFF